MIAYRQARKAVVLLIGSTVILFGVVLLVLPGPGLLVIALGLAILAAEFAWARLWLRKIRHTVNDTRNIITRLAGEDEARTVADESNKPQ